MSFKKDFALPFGIGFCIYPLLEILYRQKTHISMAIIGGICFFAIFMINKFIPRMKYLLKVLLSSVVITEIEFLSGCFLNVYMKLDVWNYESAKFNLLGQICPQYFCYWFLLSAISIVIADIILLIQTNMDYFREL